MRVFGQKVRNLFKFLYMSLLAPAAVCLKIDWPEAYYFVLLRMYKQHKDICLNPACDSNLSKRIKLKRKIVYCIKKYIAHEPSLTDLSVFISASTLLINFCYTGQEFVRSMGILRNTEKMRRRILKDHQLDELGFEFIPRAFATGSIGAWEILGVHIKMGILGLKTPKKLVLLLDPESRVNNPCYLKYWRQYITVISDPLLIQALSPLEKCMTVPINYYMSFQGRVMLSPQALGFVRKQWNEEKRPALLKLSDDDFVKGWKRLSSLGVPNHAWFVCLHVRESGWNDNSHAGNFRNADIKTYVPAIKAIVDAGGWVVRMGDLGMTPLPPMDHVIDYAHSDAKSDWMDIFLCSQCRFLVGTSSGVHTISLVFGVPVVMTNCLPAAAMYQFTVNDLFIPRLCLSKDDDHYLSFRELMCPPVSMGAEQYVYDRLNLKVMENTPEEIKDIVMEMLMRESGTIQYSQEDGSLQEQFRSLSARCGALYGDDDIVVHARMGRDFLRKYAGLLPVGMMEECRNKG
ncbi:MAG: TIGR04372 family glycosyltransferase [Candidatus Omnitrophota bacterium]|nr:TIGR04372 family glycosyltransferase [Candidatus Omnitrophota bacterium]